MMRVFRTKSGSVIVLTILLLTLGDVEMRGQGGTGRTTPKPNPPEKLPPVKRTAPTRKTAPAFHAKNPAIELVLIPAGSFMMGSTKSDAESPVHKVTIIKPFYMGKYEVTQAQWQAVMGNNPSTHFKGDNLPVEEVSWFDAQQFIQKLNQMVDNYNYRLPSEAEWEYACRAGTTEDYAGNLHEMAWFSENSGGRIHAVGQKQSNAWGLADMHGNVWEWCQDSFHGNYHGAPAYGSVWDSTYRSYLDRRVLRGGSWDSEAYYLRSAYRFGVLAVITGYLSGFRVVAVDRT